MNKQEEILPELASHARVWVFQSDRALSGNEQQKINAIMREFIPSWAAHGNKLYGGFEVLEDHFLIIGVDESKSPASGCSIDSLTRQVKEIGAGLGINFFNRLAIAYQDETQTLQLISMAEFKARIAAGQIDMDTTVYNNLVNTQQELNEKWKTEAKKSWHANLFDLV